MKNSSTAPRIKLLPHFGYRKSNIFQCLFGAFLHLYSSVYVDRLDPEGYVEVFLPTLLDIYYLRLCIAVSLLIITGLDYFVRSAHFSVIQECVSAPLICYLLGQ